MISNWIKSLSANRSISADAQQADLERLTAQLLAEIAWSDHVIEAAEHDAIVNALVESTSLSTDEIKKILADAIADLKKTITLHEHINEINNHFEQSQKIKLVEQMWRVAFADGDLDKYEEHTIRKLSDRLYVKHRDFMQAKLRVIDQKK
jgi:uncharacterized tellurite resistance protein B-like protein